MFPIIQTLSDVLPHIKDKTEIKVWEKDSYTVIDYMLSMENTFDNPYSIECRGLIFDTATGKLLRRPLHKFFNHGERPNDDHLKLGDSYALLKLDGSMIAPWIDPNVQEIFWGTRAGQTDIAAQAVRECMTPRILREVELLIRQGYTPIFEYTSPINRIVIRYKEPVFTLLAIRDRLTGIYKNHKIVESVSYFMGLENIHHFPEIPTVTDWLDREGVVVVYENGHRVKLKAADYVLKHKTKDDIRQEKNVLKLIVTGGIDDIADILDAEDWAAVEAYKNQVLASVMMNVERVTSLVTKVADLSRKEQAMFIKDVAPLLSPMFFQILDGKEATQTILDFIEKKCQTGTTVETIRWLIGPPMPP